MLIDTLKNFHTHHSMFHISIISLEKFRFIFISCLILYFLSFCSGQVDTFSSETPSDIYNGRFGRESSDENSREAVIDLSSSSRHLSEMEFAFDNAIMDDYDTEDDQRSQNRYHRRPRTGYLHALNDRTISSRIVPETISTEEEYFSADEDPRLTPSSMSVRGHPLNKDDLRISERLSDSPRPSSEMYEFSSSSRFNLMEDSVLTKNEAHADTEDGVFGVEMILRQVKGMEEMKNLLFDILFSRDRIITVLNTLLAEQRVEKAEILKHAYLDVKNIKVVRLERPSYDNIALTESGIDLEIRDLSFAAQLDLRVFSDLWGLKGGLSDTLTIDCKNVSFFSRLIPEMVHSAKDTSSFDGAKTGPEEAAESRRMIIHVRKSDIQFNSRLDWSLRHTWGSNLGKFIYRQVDGFRFLGSWLRKQIGVQISNAIRSNVPQASHQLVHSNTAALLNIVDSWMKEHIGFDLHLSENFYYRNPHMRVGDGFIKSQANLIIQDIPESKITTEEWKKWFLGPKPQTWNTGDSKGGNRVDLRNDSQFKPHRNWFQKTWDRLKWPFTRLFGG